MTKRKTQQLSDYKINRELTEKDKQEIDKILNSDEMYRVFEYWMDKYAYRDEKCK